MRTVSYIQGADLPNTAIAWTDADDVLVPFADGHTFELRVGTPGSPAELVKTDGITGSDEDPNVVIAWDAELDELEPGHYTADLVATRDSDGKERKMRFRISIKAEVEAGT